MPKGKGKKTERKQRTGRDGAANGHLVLPPEDDMDQPSPDNMSTASNYSDSQSIAYDDGEEEVDDLSAQEDFEEKLKDVIDGLTEKSAKGRVDCLKSLTNALSKKYIYDFVENRKMTLQDSLERCIKKGKGEEQKYAAMATSLLLLQLGASEDSEDILRGMRPILQTVMLDHSASCHARGACAESLSLCAFVAGGEMEQVRDIMRALERVYQGSYVKGDGTARALGPEVTAMHNSALAAWSLLLSISPPSIISDTISSHLRKMQQLLLSPDVELRVTAGEVIALMYELAREEDEDFEGDDFMGLCDTLKKLATECNKYKSKKARRLQRASFRDVLRAVEEGDYPRLRVKFGLESVAINSWTRKCHYDTLCHLLGSGMPRQLQENELVREVFGLGSPIPMADLTLLTKSSRNERHMFNAAAFKARTKARSKVRDKRSVGATGTD